MGRLLTSLQILCSLKVLLSYLVALHTQEVGFMQYATHYGHQISTDDAVLPSFAAYLLDSALDIRTITV